MMQDIMCRLFGRAVANQRYRLACRYVRGHVLDVGCGRGQLATSIKTADSYTGVDRNDSFLDVPGCRFVQADIENAENIGWFDTVVMLAVLEHLRRPERALKWVRGQLLQDGRLIITTPTAKGNIVVRCVFNRGIDHYTIYDRGSVAALLESCGFRIKLYRRFEMGMNQLVVAEVV